MDVQTTINIEGLEEHLKQIQAFTPKKQRAIIRSSFQSATGPIKTGLRRYIKQRIYRFGHLVKAIRSKVKSYASGVVVVIVGATNRRLGNNENPGNYFHLADAGTRPHQMTRTHVRVNGVIIRLHEPETYTHPGAEPAGVREAAFRFGRPKVEARFLKQWTKRIQKCLTQN